MTSPSKPRTNFAQYERNIHGSCTRRMKSKKTSMWTYAIIEAKKD
jgi:hypothetical protein